MVNTITYEELKALLANNKDLTLIDVRTDGEVNTGRIPGSIHIPVQRVDAALKMHPDDFKAKYGAAKPQLNDPHLVFYCQSGGRSAVATSTARKQGYFNASNYAGAYIEWSARERK